MMWMGMLVSCCSCMSWWVLWTIAVVICGSGGVMVSVYMRMWCVCLLSSVGSGVV